MPEPSRASPAGTRVVCVLGMHRSGTSCLAGTLEEAGLHLGEVVTAAPHNRKGNRENLRIMALHEGVLSESGGAWDRPPPSVRWSEQRRAERDAIIDGYAERPVWGFKCPRTLLTVGGWLEAIPELSFVGTFRHPMLVAESLRRRNGDELERWIELWVYYNEKLLELRRQEPFPLVCFDWDAETYRRRVASLVQAMGFEVPATFAFFDPELRHDGAPELPLPPRTRELYAELTAACRDC